VASKGLTGVILVRVANNRLKAAFFQIVRKCRVRVVDKGLRVLEEKVVGGFKGWQVGRLRDGATPVVQVGLSRGGAYATPGILQQEFGSD
jgi:hypothetical protein